MDDDPGGIRKYFLIFLLSCTAFLSAVCSIGLDDFEMQPRWVADSILIDGADTEVHPEYPQAHEIVQAKKRVLSSSHRVDRSRQLLNTFEQTAFKDFQIYSYDDSAVSVKNKHYPPSYIVQRVLRI